LAGSQGLCDPTAGTAIVVGATGGPQAVVSGIDFTLGSTEIFVDGFESGDVSAWSNAVGASSP
jgi:hypothetical protein